MPAKFFPYLLAGYPSLSAFSELLSMTHRYADTIEIGIPFSDPVADGPVIRKASEQVLARGFDVDFVFNSIRQSSGPAPVAVMCYANVVHAYPREAFFKACRQSGASSIIVPDVPYEESMEWETHAAESGLNWIRFVSLTTRLARLKQIASSARGFIYLLGVTGITGSNIQIPETIRRTAEEIRKHTTTPIALGFGVKSPDDARPFHDCVDAFIVGSRLIELAGQGIPEVENLYKSFRT